MKSIGAILISLLLAMPGRAAEPVVVGSKTFTESIILGYVLTDMAREGGFDATHRADIGGTRIVFDALVRGDIDLYVDYTGTITRELLADQNLAGEADIRRALAKLGVGLGPKLGFNNTYVLAMRADALPDVQKTSDLKNYPGLAFGFGNEFLDRADGWPALQRAYDLPQSDVRGLEHELSYRALASGAVDVIDAYSTDANIARYDLRLLPDDRIVFPQYDAVILYRTDLDSRAPGLIAHLSALDGAIDEAKMRALNAQVTLDGRSEQQAAAGFLNEVLRVNASAAQSEGFWARMWHNTLDHLTLVAISLTAAILVALPLGIVAFRRPRTGQLILAATGMLQTIPSLALFVFMIPLVGIGGPPAMIALFLYSLLPIVRNTHTGLSDIAPSLRESAQALGLPHGVILRKIELPLAARSILSGIKTAAVINVGTATLGALIGAGGYGQPILSGIRLADTGLILEGAIPAALLALATQAIFELCERAVVPLGLRLPATGGDA